MLNGTESAVADLGYLQVYVISIEPSIVLPSAPGVIRYTFAVTGEGIQEQDVDVREVIIGSVRCTEYVEFPDQEKRLDCNVLAPELWPDTTVYYLLASDGGQLTET